MSPIHMTPESVNPPRDVVREGEQLRDVLRRRIAAFKAKMPRDTTAVAVGDAVARPIGGDQ